MLSKVAILIPSTTRQRAWKNIKETDLYKVQLKSFLLTYDPEHIYTYYIGIDDDDPLYSQPAEKKRTLTVYFYYEKRFSPIYLIERYRKGAFDINVESPFLLCLSRWK